MHDYKDNSKFTKYIKTVVYISVIQNIYKKSENAAQLLPHVVKIV